jgi:hypothetical protein
MNSYDRLFNILTESTPIGREKSKDIGRGFGAAISLTKPGPYGTPSRMGIDPKHAAATAATLTKKAKKEGGQAVRTGKLRIRAAARKVK